MGNLSLVTSQIAPRTAYDDNKDLSSVLDSKTKNTLATELTITAAKLDVLKKESIDFYQLQLQLREELEQLDQTKAEYEEAKKEQNRQAAISQTAQATISSSGQAAIKALQEKIKKLELKIEFLTFKLEILRNTIPPIAKAVDNYTQQNIQQNTKDFTTVLDIIFFENDPESEQEKKELVAKFEDAASNRRDFYHGETVYLNSVLEQAKKNPEEPAADLHDIREQKNVILHIVVQDEVSLMFQLVDILRKQAAKNGQTLDRRGAIYQASAILADVFNTNARVEKLELVYNAEVQVEIAKASKDLNQDRAEAGITGSISRVRELRNEIHEARRDMEKCKILLKELVHEIKATRAELDAETAKINYYTRNQQPRPQFGGGNKLVDDKEVQNNSRSRSPFATPQCVPAGSNQQ